MGSVQDFSSVDIVESARCGAARLIDLVEIHVHREIRVAGILLTPDTADEYLRGVPLVADVDARRQRVDGPNVARALFDHFTDHSDGYWCLLQIFGLLFSSDDDFFQLVGIAERRLFDRFGG